MLGLHIYVVVCTLAYQGLFTVEVPTGPRLFAGRCATLEETYGPGETRWKPRAVTFRLSISRSCVARFYCESDATSTVLKISLKQTRCGNLCSRVLLNASRSANPGACTLRSQFHDLCQLLMIIIAKRDVIPSLPSSGV